MNLLFGLLLLLSQTSISRSFRGIGWLGSPWQFRVDSIQSLRLRSTSVEVHPNADANRFGELINIFQEMNNNIEGSYVDGIVTKLTHSGFQDTEDLRKFASDFQTRPEILSSVLKNDFEFNIYDSHKLRAALMMLMQKQKIASPIQLSSSESAAAHDHRIAEHLSPPAITSISPSNISNPVANPISMKKFKVNLRSIRQLRSADTSFTFEYGLTKANTPPALAKELESFYAYMTEMSPTAQEPPIRGATADVYLRHGRLFLGWHLSNEVKRGIDPNVVGTLTAFPSKSRESAKHAFDFIKWLRVERRISVNYEANLIRGLIKLAKFRFAQESATDPSYGEKSFDDIPVIRELRKIHRDASISSTRSTSRVSDEKKKWIDWTEYLDVVEKCKVELSSLLEEYREIASMDTSTKSSLSFKRKVAIAYQQYLILAIFSIIPDRQRTIRELEIGRTFIKEELAVGYQWIVKHGPDDYKTGKSYGDRPPLPISNELTQPVDDFIREFRPCLEPQGAHLFTQTKNGGKAMNQDSIYQVVSRVCYKHSGKRTNPHLLRDMVVTHVRSETAATEKDLEALALYMGHSLSMQKKSYDRRTLDQKVAPAVSLVQGLGKKMQIPK